MILLLAAVPAETERIRQTMQLVEEVRRTTFILQIGRIGERHVGLIHGGVGKVNTAVTLTSLLERADVELVLQFGCGGAYPKSGLTIGDLVLANEEIYGDEGSLSPDGFLDMKSLHLPTSMIDGHPFYNRYPLRSRLVDCARELLVPWADAWSIQLKCGPCVTVSTCSGLHESALSLSERTGGLCESMEGAAAAHICAQRGIPFLELRGISNLTLDRDFDSWDIPVAVDHAQAAVMHLLEHWSLLETAE